jgi:hypothetical protein
MVPSVHRILVIESAPDSCFTRAQISAIVSSASVF